MLVCGPELPTGESRKTSQSALLIHGPVVRLGAQMADNHFSIGTAGSYTRTVDWGNLENRVKPRLEKFEIFNILMDMDDILSSCDQPTSKIT